MATLLCLSAYPVCGMTTSGMTLANSCMHCLADGMVTVSRVILAQSVLASCRPWRAAREEALEASTTIRIFRNMVSLAFQSASLRPAKQLVFGVDGATLIHIKEQTSKN